MTLQTTDTDTTVISLRWRPTIKFSTRLREVRLDYGRMTGQRIDQEQMAELLGVKVGTYKGWETGNSKPADLIAMAQLIGRVTGVDPAWLLDVAEDDRRGPNPTPGLPMPRFTWIHAGAGQEVEHREHGRDLQDLAA
jgi:transcriptional regulator with XRE-family HTH domain